MVEGVCVGGCFRISERKDKGQRCLARKGQHPKTGSKIRAGEERKRRRKKMDKHAGGREGIERFGDGGERMGGWKKRAKGRKKGAPGGRGV
jgi:hypothetical protein